MHRLVPGRFDAVRDGLVGAESDRVPGDPRPGRGDDPAAGHAARRYATTFWRILAFAATALFIALVMPGRKRTQHNTYTQAPPSSRGGNEHTEHGSPGFHRSTRNKTKEQTTT
jgi:hypothetical protein